MLGLAVQAEDFDGFCKVSHFFFLFFVPFVSFFSSFPVISITWCMGTVVGGEEAFKSQYVRVLREIHERFGT